MAMVFTFSVLENSARNYILGVVGIDTATVVAFTSDGSSTGIVAANGYAPTTSFKVRRILYNASNCIVRAQWHQTTNAEAFNLSGYGAYDLRDCQGLINPKGTGSTGDIDLLTYPVASVTSGAGIITAAFTLTIEAIKGA